MCGLRDSSGPEREGGNGLVSRDAFAPHDRGQHASGTARGLANDEQAVCGDEVPELVGGARAGPSLRHHRSGDGLVRDIRLDRI